jgi:uncharacterized protein
LIHNQIKSRTMTKPISSVTDALTLTLDPLPLPQQQIMAGQPQTYGKQLEISADGTRRSGVWEITPGTVWDIESEEIFIVLKGRARVETPTGLVLDLHPGSVGFLRAGDRTVWHVEETLRKVYQMTTAV